MFYEYYKIAITTEKTLVKLNSSHVNSFQDSRLTLTRFKIFNFKAVLADARVTIVFLVVLILCGTSRSNQMRWTGL